FLPRLIRIPREVRDVDVRTDTDGAVVRTGVAVALQRDVDARVRLTLVLRQDARVDGAGGTPVVKGNGDRAGRAGGHGRLELVGRRRIRIVVDGLRRLPREAAVRRLREVDVHVPAGRVIVLVRQVDVTRPARAGGEVLDDP